jgi:2-C-methyl-D-erythritol 2,4-cyclodiphosphate synthase
MFRIGIGHDTHRLEQGRKLVLGGVLVESEAGAVGHSDADALCHAVTDALLGALALGDIGAHFPDTDERWSGADSLRLLAQVVEKIEVRGWRVVNLDSIVMIERPRLRPYVERMRERLAEVLKVEIDCVSVKAKTGEGVDAVGEGRAVTAQAIALIERRGDESRA